MSFAQGVENYVENCDVINDNVNREGAKNNCKTTNNITVILYIFGNMFVHFGSQPRKSENIV